VQEADLDHALDLAVVRDRRDQQFARRRLAQRRTDLDVVLRQLAQGQDAVLVGGLAGQRFAGWITFARASSSCAKP
jgi:coenzyme F420-reducing hydrogenase delta subunit